MGLIQDLIRRRKEKKEAFKRMQMQDRMENALEERKLSNDERFFLRWQEEERQKRLKEIVKRIKHKQDREFWSGKKNNAVFASNIFRNNENIFRHSQDIMKDDKNLFKGGNIFKK